MKVIIGSQMIIPQSSAMGCHGSSSHLLPGMASLGRKRSSKTKV